MRPVVIARFIAILSTGLIAGILLGDRMGATFARPALSVPSFVTFQQVLHERFVPMMPILMVTATLANLAWLVMLRPRPADAEFVLVVVATLAIISVFAITRAINVPINVELMKWDAASPPANVREVWARWETAHTVRTVIALLGFSLGTWRTG